MDESNVEKAPNGAKTEDVYQVEEKQTALKLDRHGLPLVPQPSDHEDDPLNWPKIYRIYIALLISLVAFVAQMGSALINPAFEEMSEDLGVSVPQASYCTTVFILFGGVLSMFVVSSNPKRHGMRFALIDLISSGTIRQRLRKENCFRPWIGPHGSRPIRFSWSTNVRRRYNRESLQWHRCLCAAWSWGCGYL